MTVHVRAADKACLGPIRSAHCALPLSTYRREALPDDRSATWTRVLEARLRERGAAPATRLASLMQRVLAARAVAGPHPFQPSPADWQTPDASTVRVLIVDERQRVARGRDARRPRDFAALLAAVRERHRGADVRIAASADGGRGAWLSSRCAASLIDGFRLASDPGLACAMLPHADHVYVLGASEGMLALLAGKPVHVFGMPNYAGWGLTHDQRPIPGRTARPSLERLFECVYLDLARYLDPATHGEGNLDGVLAHLELQAAVRARFAMLDRVAGVRFQWWKRPFATPYLQAGAGRLRWEREPRHVAPGETAALWGGRNRDALAAEAAALSIEDGFIHSHGLGSDMIAPRSQVLDLSGIYFDATRPSDLLAILNHASFDADELVRAEALRQLVVAHGITKYNLGRRQPAWKRPTGRTVALVIGQVADDASIRLGTATIRTADELLRTVRARHPDAFIVYKPHPDVLSGNRNGLIEAAALADVVDPHADVVSLIEACDTVHTLSSLAGFDALLRGKTVHTYGLPFYAGWGLTIDELAQPRRERPLSLAMLVAGVLLRYPVYWDWRLGMYTTPEAVVQQLAPQAARALTRLRGDRLRPARKALRWLRNLAWHAVWRYRNPDGRARITDS